MNNNNRQGISSNLEPSKLYLFTFQELKDQAPPVLDHDQNQTEKQDPSTYLWKDVYGMVSFQKSLVKHIYVTPIWWNGRFVRPFKCEKNATKKCFGNFQVKRVKQKFEVRPP